MHSKATTNFATWEYFEGAYSAGNKVCGESKIRAYGGYLRFSGLEKSL